ncbi:MAG: response regulator transcription factor [Bacilli bacterium]
MKKILIIEDDDVIGTGLKYYLDAEDFEVYLAKTAKESLSIISNINDLNIILLDINLPDMSGFDLFKKIKEIKNIPIIFLTANDLEISIVRGLDMGADDYITKPFKARELISRINAVLRRNGNSNRENIINIGNVSIDINQAKVMKNNEVIFLTALEYKILLLLVLNPNIIFTREKILADIWDVSEEYVNDNTLTVYIKRIREKIEDDPSNPKIIKTIRGIGYKIGIYDE